MDISKRKLKYKKHIFTNLNDIIEDFKTNASIEGRKMFSALQPTILKLQNNDIHNLKDITTIFKDCGFNNKSTNQIIFYLMQKLEEDSIGSNRIISKLNNTYRNIIFNWLFFQYPDKIIELIDSFVSKHCSDIHNHDFLIYKLKEQIDKGGNEKEKCKENNVFENIQYPILFNNQSLNLPIETNISFNNPNMDEFGFILNINDEEFFKDLFIRKDSIF